MAPAVVCSILFSRAVVELTPVSPLLLYVLARLFLDEADGSEADRYGDKALSAGPGGLGFRGLELTLYTLDPVSFLIAGRSARLRFSPILSVMLILILP